MEFAEFIKTPMVNSVSLRKPFCKPVEGTLCITGHHLILSSKNTNKEELWLLHTSVDSVEKRLTGTGGVVMIRCKDFTKLALDIPTAEECLNVAASVEQLSNIDDVTLKYPFFYRPMFGILEDGWQAFKPESELARYKECSDEWRISTANKDYKLCQSYPQSVFVPKSVTDEMLVRVAQFRQNGRFPVLSYYHRDSKVAACVLVHGSEGVDTTLQVTSLAQVIMDHDCRTFTGFEALIEREWLQAGHPFMDRCAKSAHAFTKQRQESPVFLLFLDCVWQIWQQFPCSFEFTEDFLILLFEHAYSSQFGTFLCNSDLERTCLKLDSRTVSLWSYLNRPEVLANYINPMYDPNPAVIWPSVAPQSLGLWNGLYLRSHVNQAKITEAWTEISKIREYDKELRSKVTKLRRRLASLEKEALTAGVILPSTLDGDVN